MTKRICSLLTLIVWVLAKCIMPMSYVLAENNAEQDFLVEENIIQEEEEGITNISETEEDTDNSIIDTQEDEEEIIETVTADTEDEEIVEDDLSEIQNSGEEQEGEIIEVATGVENDEENIEVTVDTGDNEENISDNKETTGDNEQTTELTTTGTDNNGQEMEQSIISEPTTQEPTTPLVETGDNEEGVVDTITQEIEEIITKVRYFFKKEGDSRYIKYGKDKNNIGTITLKDPKSGASITIMDKNLGADSVGVGKSSYGYYFQWGNNYGLKTINSSNKTTQKAVYKDSYYNRGYDGQGLFIVGSTDYWEDGSHYNSLWGNESKESSRYGACPVGYHIPTMKEWNELLSIWGKIHTQDTSENNMVLRYSADYSTKNIHKFKTAATQCVQGETDCVDEDKLSSIVEILSSELKLPLAGSYDENGNFHDGLGVYWTSISKNGNMAGVFDMDAYVGGKVDESLMYRSQGHTIRCFQNLEPYEAPVVDEEPTPVPSETQNSEEEQDTLIDTQNEEELQGTGEVENGTGITLPDIESNPTIQDITGDLVNEEKEVKKYIITWRNEDGTVRDITTVEYGQMPTYSNVDQPSDSRYSYTFAGWDPELKVVDGDADYRATYTYTVNKYTVTWKDENGKVLETDEVEYGSIPTYDGEIPEKQPTDEYTYTFAGWEPTISEVKGNAVYVAKFDAIKIEKQEVEDSSADNSQAGSKVDSSTSSQNDNNMSSGTEWNGSEGSYSSFGGGGGNTQDSSSDKPASELQSGDIESGSAIDLLEETIEAQAETGEVVEYTDADREAELIQIWNTLNEKEIGGRKASHHIIVDVSAPVGAFPEGTQLRITPIENQRMAQELKDQLVENTDVTQESELVSFDISFIYKLSNGEEIELQPKEGKTVKVSFNYEYNDSFSDADNNESKELKVYHFEEQTDNEGNKTEEVEIKEIKVNERESSEGELVIDAERFSVYTIVTQFYEEGNTRTWKLGKDYYEIEVKSGSNCITVMDRNLGATAAGAGNTSSKYTSHGYYYQWGNNYGFAMNGSLPSGRTHTVPNTSSALPGSYASSSWVATNMWTNNANLWGGGSDSDSNNFTPIVTNFEQRQGPCPDGWHVPSAGEWGRFISYGGVVSGYSVSNDGGNFFYIGAKTDNQKFYNLLKFPFAGQIISTSGKFSSRGTVGYLWTSSRYNGKVLVVRGYNSNSIGGTYSTHLSSPGIGTPVRCFKNTYECKPSGTCTMADGTVVTNGATVTGYPNAMVASGQTCQSQQLTCNASANNLSGYFSTCHVYGQSGDVTTTEYLITFVNYDGTVLQSGMVAEGTTPAYNGATPTRSADAQYTYAFSGWTPALTGATQAQVYTATYTQTINQYTATIAVSPAGYGTVNTGSVKKDYNSNITTNGNQITIGGTTVIASPTANGAQYTYTFSGWTNTCGSNGTKLTGNCTITAQFKRTTNKYLITFKDGDGSTIQSGMIEYGTTPAYNGATPTKAATAQYTYTWNNTWSPAIHSVTGDETYVAQFDSTVNEYTITWNYRDANGVQTQSTGNVAYGQTPSAPSLPATSQSQSTVYTFTSWSPSVASVTGPATYNAQYSESPRQYTITWKNDDGTTIDTTTVNYGATPTHADATKANTAEYTYTFAGWTPAIENVTGDATYTAQFNSTVNNYEVTIVSSDTNSGTVSTGSVTVPYGTSVSTSSNTLTIGSNNITANPNPQTAQYTYAFKDWTNTCGNEVEGTCTITANFISTLRSYIITWENEDGTPLETDSDVPYGTTPTYDGATPQKAATEEFTYTFDTWSPAVSSVTGDATYTATYTSTVNVYTASIVAAPAGYGTVNKSSVAANYGTSISTNSNTLTIGSTTVTATPTASDAQYTYTFTGWTFNNCGSEGFHQIRSGCTITANFERTVNTYTITWENDDHSVLETDTDVPYGTMPTYDGATPQKTGSLIYSYVFSGWTPTIHSVTGNQTYTAVYTRTNRKYTVTWRNTDGAVLETDEDVGYGATPEYNGATPTNGVSNQYVTSSFAGWNPTISTVEKDIEYFARYTYTVASGMVLDTSKDSVSVTLNANGGEFSNNSGYDILNYDYYNRAEKKYAHSANYSDDGIRNTAASSSDAKQYLTTITGAEYLYVNLTYDLHEILLGWVNNNKDKLSIYAGTTTSATAVAHFSGNTNDGIQGGGNYTITGESVLFDFYLANRNISSMESNGFYAVIVGVIPVGYITDDEATTPTREGYTFNGWYTQAEGGDLVDLTGLVVSGNMEVYAHWTPKTNIQYVVYHYVKKVGESGYALTQTETGYGTTDATLILSGLAKSNIVCASYDRGSLTGTEAGPGVVVNQTTIKGDGSTKIYLYYARNTRTVTLSGDEHINYFEINGEEKSEAVRECGGGVSVNAEPDPGYHFVRWDREESRRRDDAAPGE